MSGWESLAVFFGVVYVVLAAKEKFACWYAAFISSCIFTVLFWDVNLLMTSLQNIYYVIMAVYGAYQWKFSKQARSSKEHQRPIRTWPARLHCIVLGNVIFLALITAHFLGVYTRDTSPFLDAFTTWGALVTTYMVANKILENWVYWIFFDGLSAGLYASHEMYQTAFLSIVYVVVALFGFVAWLRHYRHNQAVGVSK